MSVTDLKTSIFVQKQIPEFVKDEYPKFVSFLEAYYDFLEARANTTTTSNNLVTSAKTLRNIKDVDDSIEQFEKNFYNTYASLIPLEVQSNKALLFKHLANLYRSKGNENSFKLLFQLIFGQDIDIIYPKNNVLRASASKWKTDTTLRINPDVYSRYVGDGTNTIFYLAQKVELDEVNIFVDDVLKTAEVDYYINIEYRRLVFINPPANGAIITAKYIDFNVSLFENRKVTGITTGSTAIVESANKRIVADIFILGLPIELIVNNNSLKGSFLTGETVSIPIIDDINNVTIDLRATSFSVIKKFNIINSGNNYSVGDIISVSGGNATSNALGVVASISSGTIDSGLIHHGGAAFSISSPISISGNDAFSTMLVVVDGIDTSGTNAANTLIISPDVISNLNFNVGEVYVNTSNFGAVFSKSNVSAANTIGEALNFISFQVGPITNVSVLSSTVPLNQKDFIVFDAAGADFGANTPKRYSKSLRSIGRYKIIDGGSNYKIGDEIVFGTNPLGTYGQHAAATVGKIAANGYIERIDAANSRISGVGTVSAACNEIVGTGTAFDLELVVGDRIDINNESKVVASITNNTILVVDSVYTYSATDKPIGVYGRWPLGGYGYTQNNFPSITVSSTTGSNAIVQIDSLTGDNEQISAQGFGANGQITSVNVIDPGSGYEYIPSVSVLGGDGTAVIRAEIEQSLISTSGRWTTSDSILSSFERKIQGEDYYVDYSYVLSSQIEFSKYKAILKQLLHPVGLVNYAFYNKQNVIELTDVLVQDVKETTISGRANVGNGGAVVVGDNTKFNIANTLGIITLNSLIAVNGEVRKINTIVSNTKIITTSNISNLTIANSGSGYSNGYLVFANGGGQVTSLTITNSGSGYENGTVKFSGTDEAIAAVANVEVYASNGSIRTLTLISGGLYANKPIALPDTNPHRVLYANGITITNRGQGYSNGWLSFTGGSPLRDANVQLIVHPNTVINTVIVHDSGLYQIEPTSVTPNTNPNVVISEITVTSKGNGHSNGVLTFSGGNPTRAATVSVETFPPQSAQVVSIVANTNAHSVNGYILFTGTGKDNISANARIYVNTTGAIENVTVLNRGLYVGTPTATANVGNAIFTLTMLPLDGQIRKIVIVDPGLYTSTPSATLNTSPNSVIDISSNTATNVYVGRSLANGYLIFTGGDPVRDANATYEVYPSNGVINMQSIVITDVGLYRRPPTFVRPNITPVSITQVLPLIGGSGYVNGNVVFSTTQATANIVANCVVTVNSTGAIVRTRMNDVGLYANGADVIVVGILDPATATLQTPTTAASFSIGFNANTTNVANLVVTTSVNVGQTAVVGVIANSNTYTNATFSLVAVANAQTNAVISVGFVEQNTAANVLVEVYSGNGAIRKLTTNSSSVIKGVGEYYYTPDSTPNSAGSGAVIKFNPVSWYQTANLETAVVISTISTILVTTESEAIIQTEFEKELIIE
jgi:hypothetical protein